MRRVETRDLSKPDEVVEFPLGRTETVTVGSMVVGRNSHQPGWRWSEHVKPIVGTEWCEFHHVGFVLSGRLRIVLPDGAAYELGPGTVFDVPPGHDGMVIGEEPVVTIDWIGTAGWAAPPAVGERIVRTLMFTDIVDSTATAQRIGDTAWNRLLGAHNEAVRIALEVYRGYEVNTTGDGFLVAFDGAGRAIRAAVDIRRATAELGLRLRAAVHTGEVEVVSGDVRGVAVHEAARIVALARADEILVSAVTRELASAADVAFTDRGLHHLRGLTGERRLYAVT